MARGKADPEQVLSVFRKWLEAMEATRQEASPHEVLTQLDAIEKLYAPVVVDDEKVEELEFRNPDPLESSFWIG